MKNIEETIDKHYDQMFDELISLIGDDLHELKIEVQTRISGKTIIRSWQDRDRRIEM